MFPAWLNKLVLVLAAALLPLQALAETVQVFLCQPQMAVNAGVEPGNHDRFGRDGGTGHAYEGAVHDHGRASGDEGTLHSHSASAHGSDEDSAGGHAEHFCCDVVVAGLPSSSVTVAAAPFPALEATRDIFHYLTFLEFPQRPPLP
jgi:hypothetical protein